MRLRTSQLAATWSGNLGYLATFCSASGGLGRSGSAGWGMRIDPATRVCPRCGSPADRHEYCQTCGLHLFEQPELPTRAAWAEGGAAAQSPSSASARWEAAKAAVRNADRRLRLIVVGAPVVLLVVGAWVFFGPVDTPIDIGKEPEDGVVGDSSDDGRQDSQNPPVDRDTLEVEAAVADRAQTIYRNQQITGASCEKSGFTVGGTDLYSCSLSTPDGPTVPSQWQILRNPSMTPPIYATPYSGG